MTPLPLTWIESLFKRFEGMYGKSFHAKWDGMDIENIKRVWAEDLGEFSGETINAALQACRETCEHPPSSASFISFARPVGSQQSNNFMLCLTTNNTRQT